MISFLFPRSYPTEAKDKNCSLEDFCFVIVLLFILCAIGVLCQYISKTRNAAVKTKSKDRSKDRFEYLLMAVSMAGINSYRDRIAKIRNS